MEIFPAIDVIDGKVVRLFQGDYEKKQVFGGDPAAQAKKFYDDGARFLHLVDLDGAKEGKPCNFDAVRAIAAVVPEMSIEFGGGIRDELSVERCFSAGISRVILGTAALRDRAFTERMVRRYGEKIAIGVDARNGKVAVEGWLDTSDVDSVEFCREMVVIGVRYIIYTDISRDGVERGANLAIYKMLSQIDGVSITASGGVSSLGDIKALREMGLYAAIIGKALYTGGIDIKEAIRIGRE